jgi:hypothetical protein
MPEEACPRCAQVRVWHLPKKPSTRNNCVEILRIQDLQSSVVAADFTEDGSRVIGLLAGKQVFVWHATTGVALIWWLFSPFDHHTYGESLWRTGRSSIHLDDLDDLDETIEKSALSAQFCSLSTHLPPLPLFPLQDNWL